MSNLMRLYEMEKQLFDMMMTIRSMIWENNKSYVVEPNNVSSFPDYLAIALECSEKSMSLDELNNLFCFKNVPPKILEEVLLEHHFVNSNYLMFRITNSGKWTIGYNNGSTKHCIED